jgi:hypothetical protein
MNGGNIDPLCQTLDQILSRPLILPESDPDGLSYQIALDLTKFHFDECGLEWPLYIEPAVSTPTHHMQKMRQKHIEYIDIRPLCLDQRGLFITSTQTYPTFMSVMEELFVDGRISFERIVEVYSYCALLSVECLEANYQNLIPWVIDWTASFNDNILGEWMEENGGWDGFVSYFCARRTLFEMLLDKMRWPKWLRLKI